MHSTHQSNELDPIQSNPSPNTPLIGFSWVDRLGWEKNTWVELGSSSRYNVQFKYSVQSIPLIVKIRSVARNFYMRRPIRSIDIKNINHKFIKYEISILTYLKH